MGRKKNQKARQVKMTFMVGPDPSRSHHCPYCLREGTKQQVELHMVTECPSLGHILVPHAPVHPLPEAVIQSEASSSGILSLTKPMITMLITGKANAGKSEILKELLLSLGDDKSYSEKLLGPLDEDTEWVVDLETHKLGLIDCSSSKEKLKSMIEGTFIADQNLFVVEAGTKIDLDCRPPPEEHSVLAFTLGVKQLLCVVTKMDTVGYDKEVFDSIKKKITRVLSEIGYNAARLNVIPVAAISGVNITERSDKMMWFDGPCLVDALLGQFQVGKDFYRNLRFPIKSVNGVDELVTWVTGRVAAGCLTISDNVIIGPGLRSKNKVVDMKYVDNGTKIAISEATKGYTVEIALKRKYGDAHKGSVLSSSTLSPVEGINGLVAQVMFLSHPDLSKVRAGFKCNLLIHEAELEAEIIQVICLVDRIDGSKLLRDPALLQAGDSAIVEIIADQPFIAEKISDYPLLGRICIISNNDVLCVGVVKERRQFREEVSKREDLKSKREGLKKKKFREVSKH